MTTRKAGLVLVVLLLAGMGLLAAGGPPDPAPTPQDTFSFVALGDVPYYPWEELQFQLVLDALNQQELAWVLHVGDIFWRPCSDALYRESLERMNGLRHPVIYTPGDNEWTDCWEPGSGGYQPLDRLKRIRETFFSRPHQSLGGSPVTLATQKDSETYSDFVENARWTHANIVFATVHMVGSWNGKARFPNRTPEDQRYAERRTEAACSWLRETFAEAQDTRAEAVVLAFHANPGFEDPAEHPYRKAYEPFLTVLEEEVEAFAKPVLVIQGDDHEYLVDKPLHRRTTGKLLGNFTRLQVPGSPRVGWVRVTVTPGNPPLFAFEETLIPWWKYW